MSRSWGRAHLRGLLREPRARPLPGAALSRVTAAEVVGSSRQEAETHGLTDRETRRHEGGARSARPTPEPAGTAPAPTCARTRGQVSGSAAPAVAGPRGPPEPHRRCLFRRIAYAQQVGYVTALARSLLHPVLPKLRAATRQCPGTVAGGGQARLGEGVGKGQRRGWGVVSGSSRQSPRQLWGQRSLL